MMSRFLRVVSRVLQHLLKGCTKVRMSNTLQLVPSPDAELPGRIGQARRFKGYTQQQLADLVGVSLRAYQNWERGANDPTIGGLRRISAATGFPIMWFIEDPEGGDDDGGGPVVTARYLTLARAG